MDSAFERLASSCSTGLPETNDFGHRESNGELLEPGLSALIDLCLQKGVLSLAKKYSIEGVRDNIGEWIAAEITKEQERQMQHTMKRVNPIVGKSGMKLFSLIILGAQFELGKVYETCVEYFRQVLHGTSCEYDMNDKHKYTGGQLADLIEQLMREGCHMWANNLSVKIIGGLIHKDGCY